MIFVGKALSDTKKGPATINLLIWGSLFLNFIVPPWNITAVMNITRILLLTVE